ncbi:DUF6883 domain-containing protein [Methylobacterium sp. JK268]
MTSPKGTVTWLIPRPKITAYLLDLQHPRGGSKAKFLIGFGFTPDAPDVLANALVAHARGNPPGLTIFPQKGLWRIVFEGPVTAPDGRQMPLRTVWEPRDLSEMHFITAIPLTR